MSSPDDQLARLAARQRGVLSREQARSSGLSDRQIRRRVATGVWAPVHCAAFRLRGVPRTPESDVIAAVLALPDSWISHSSAALLRGRPVGPFRRPEITRPHGRGASLAGVVVHQSTSLPAHHLTRLDGLPITTRERTVFDLAGLLDDRRLARFLDDQLVAGELVLARVERVYRDLAGFGRTGTRRLARILDERAGAPPSESELEDRFLRLCRRFGVDSGQRQFRAPWDPDGLGRARVDVAYPASKLIVELDGRRYHAQLEAMAADRRRDQLAVLAGWRTMRFTWSQIVDEPVMVASTLRAALTLDR